MGDWSIRILHISDLHERGSREREPWRRRRVLGDAWLKNLDGLLEGGPFDLVCFTGDVADRGKPEEYGRATDFVEALLEKTKVPPERLFVVPGNHDIDRGAGEEAWGLVRKKASGVPSLGFARWLAGGEAPPGFEAKHREELLFREAPFQSWLKSIGRGDLLPSESPHRRLGYRRTLTLPGLPFPVHVIGFDSAWLAGDEHDEGKVRLTDGQVGALVFDSNGEALRGFKLGLVHHPLTSLADEAECRPLIAPNVHLLLRGHRHREEAQTVIGLDGELRSAAAGCLYEGHYADQWPNACHVINAVLDDEGRPKRFEFHLRSWATGGHWFDDNSLFPDSRDGRVTRRVQPAPMKTPRRAQASSVAREEELQRLAAALLDAEDGRDPVCTVTGMAGVGKTHLVQRFVTSHGEKFPGGVVRLLLDPRGGTTVERLVADIAEQLQMAAMARTPAAVGERLLCPLTLLVVENVDSQEVAEPVAQLVTQLSGCRVVLTGRYTALGVAAGWASVPLGVLDEPEALELLAKEAGDARNEQDVGERRELVHAVGRLPLALHLAAGHLRVGGHSPKTVVERLRRDKYALKHPDPADPSGLEDQMRAVVGTTFGLSLELLRKSLAGDGDRLSSAFAALGHVAGAGFGPVLGAAATGLPEEELRTLLGHALSLSVLERVRAGERTDESWRLHPLLAEFLREKPEATEGHARLTEWFCSQLQDPGQDEQGRRWPPVHQESATLTEWLARIDGATLRRAAAVGFEFAYRCGPFPAWASAFERAVAHAKDDGERATFLFQLGHLRLRSGRPDEAMAAAIESGKLADKNRDEKCAAEATALRADILQARGQLDEALRIRKEEQLPVFERLGDVRARAVTLGQVADILQARGQLDEALRIRKEEELPVYEGLGDVRSLLAAKANLAGYLLQRARRTDRRDAADLLRQAYALAEKQYPVEAEQIRGLMRSAGVEHKNP